MISRENLLEEQLREKYIEIERLNKENNDLRKLYQRTYKHLYDIGNNELAGYFQAQIGECRTFYVEPVIDYYEETKRLNNRIDKAIEYIEELISDTKGTLNDMRYCDKRVNITQFVEDLEDDIKHYEYAIDILKGSDKE